MTDVPPKSLLGLYYLAAQGIVSVGLGLLLLILMEQFSMSSVVKSSPVEKRAREPELIRSAPVASAPMAIAELLSEEVAAVKFLAVPGSHASPAAPKVSMVVLATQIGTTLQIVFAFATRVNQAHHYHVHCPTMVTVTTTLHLVAVLFLYLSNVITFHLFGFDKNFKL